MADVAAPPVVPAAPPAAAPAPVPEPAKTNGVSADDRAKILAKARSNLRSKAEAPAPKEPAAPPVEKPTEPEKPAEKPTETPAIAAKTEDDETERLARLVREDRKLKTAAAKLEADRKSYETDIALVKAVREAKEKGDRVGMLKALFPGENPSETIFWDLVNNLAAEPEGITPESVAELMDKKLAQVEQERATRNHDEAKARLATARDAYMGACAQEFQANTDKFPLIRGRGVPVAEIEKFAIEKQQKTGSVPEPAEILAHFEEIFQKQLEKTGYVRAQSDAAPSKNGSTVSNSWTNDGGAGQTALKTASLSDKRDAIKARLREMSRRAS